MSKMMNHLLGCMLGLTAFSRAYGAEATEPEAGPKLLVVWMTAGFGTEAAPGILSYGLGLEVYELAVLQCAQANYDTASELAGCGIKFEAHPKKWLVPFAGFSVGRFLKKTSVFEGATTVGRYTYYSVQFGSAFRFGKNFELKAGLHAFRDGSPEHGDHIGIGAFTPIPFVAAAFGF